MKLAKRKWKPILWVEAIGFSFLIAMSWVTEVIRIPHLLYGEPFTANWQRAALRTVVILMVWVAVHVTTVRLLKRLYYLEGFLRICGWCRKVSDHDEWLTMEDYFSSKFSTRTSHGMCPGCLQKRIEELEQKKKSGAAISQQAS